MVATLALTIFLLVVMVGLEILPITNGNDDPVIQRQADLQLTRSIFLSRDVLVLAYRPITFRSQAVSDLQTILPVFQQVQAGLIVGDVSLGLPGNPPDNVRIALGTANSDYQQMVTALKSLLANADSPTGPDPVQVNIVLLHDRPYITAMYQAITLIQQNADARKIQLLIIKIFFIVGIVVLVMLKYLLFTRPAVSKMVLEEEAELLSREADVPPPTRDTPV